jgi:chemotaxis protein CheX
MAKDTLTHSIVEATKETFEAIGAPVDASGPPSESQDPKFGADTCVVISVVGEPNGALALRCSQKLACDLATMMLGVEIEPGSADMQDALGEVFNMIVGAMKRYLSNGSDPFKMSIPTTIIGTDYTIHVNASKNRCFLRVPFACNGEPLAIEAYTDG